MKRREPKIALAELALKISIVEPVTARTNFSSASQASKALPQSHWALLSAFCDIFLPRAASGNATA